MVRTAIGIESGNVDLLEILLLGSVTWNQWRENNPSARINLSSADLRSADIRNTKLNHADLSFADLSDANLSSANLSSANLSRTNLNGANLNGANLSRAIISNETQIDSKWKLIHQLVNEGGGGKDLRDADLSSANLNGADLSHANLSHANLNGADLSHANLNGADLSRANLSSASLNGAILSHANLSRTNFNGASLNGAILSHANLNRANLFSANLSDADLSDADLSDADLSRAILFSANLNSAILKDAKLGRANLVEANLVEADLRDANLFGTILVDANLRDAIITDETQIHPKWLSGSNQKTFPSQGTYYTFDIKVFDPDIKANDKEQLKAAIDRFAKASGYEEITEISEELGSWFKKVRYGMARLISQDTQEEAIQAGKELFRTGKSSALNRLEKPGVESTKQIAEATAEILKAVENLDDVVLLLGKLIVMKYTNNEGRSKTYVKTISSDLQLKLESTPQLLDSPQAIIDFLKSQEELPPAIEEQKTLPAVPEVLR